MAKKKIKKNKTSFTNVLNTTITILLFLIVLYLVFIRFKIQDDSFFDFLRTNTTNNETSDNDSNSGGSSGEDDGTSDDTSDEEETSNEIICGSISLGAFGDFGGECSIGFCTDNRYSCDHYWDYTNKEHKCGCAETFYCGQYCYEYYFDMSDAQNNCECPPNSILQIITRSTYVCVPNSYFCEDGEILEEVGSFPE